MSLDPTKARLLQAAGEEFAEKGFEGATIRSIVRRAGTNIAAVNYHFGDKETLYAAAVQEAHRSATDVGLPSVPPDQAENAQSQLHRFVHEFLCSVMRRERDVAWHEALTLREMIQPTAASDVLTREMIRPRFEGLLQILATLRPDLDGRRLRAVAFGIVGQCLHYKICRPISIRLVGEAAYAELDPDYLADHITSMTLASLGQGQPIAGPDNDLEH